MTFQQFIDQELDCEECPLRKSNHCLPQLTFDRDPPCSFADPDQQMEDWIKEREEYTARIEAQQDKRCKEELRKKQIAERRVKTTREMKSYCSVELKQIAFWKEVLKSTEKDIALAKCQVAAYNLAQEIFGYEKRKEVAPHLFLILEEAKQKLAVAQEVYKNKRREFYSRRKSELND